MTMVERACNICGRLYRANASKVRIGRYLTCSPVCGAKLNGRNRLGKPGRAGADNPNWKGGVSLGSHARYTDRFKAKSPEKVKAHHAVQHALAAGRLVRPDTCSKCGVMCKPHGHHDDYSKPLEVRWLCRLCHIRHHHLGRRKRAA